VSVVIRLVFSSKLITFLYRGWLDREPSHVGLTSLS
jgi:hypothetical protein